MNNDVFTNPDVRDKVIFIGIIAAILVGVEVMNLVTGYSLNAIGGLQPRDISSIFGIFTSPFLHGSVSHLLSNIFPFMALGMLIAMRGIGHFVKVSVFIMIGTGGAVWILGPSATVIVGASGVIFGYLGYILGRAFVDRKPTDIIIALIVFFVYGGMIFGVIPGTPGVSWESHLAGFVSGLNVAWMLKEKTTS